MDQARKRICELEDREFYIIWSEQRKKSEESLHDLSVGHHQKNNL